MRTFIFVTANQHKIKEAQLALGVTIQHASVELDEIQSDDAIKIASAKARFAYSVLNSPVVVWDQSIHITALGGFPGPYIRWFWESVGGEKICRIASSLRDQSIQAKTILTYYDGTQLLHFTGSEKGTIPSQPRGKGGFGWDPIFAPVGSSKTYAEMSPDDPLFHRSSRMAFAQLKSFILSENTDDAI